MTAEDEKLPSIWDVLRSFALWARNIDLALILWRGRDMTAKYYPEEVSQQAK